MTAITLNDLTTGSVDGAGIFDKLMAASEAHIHEEYQKGRIKGSEYATVYLGAMQAVMEQALQFLLTKEKAGLEADLLAKQIENAEKEGLQTDAQTDLLAAQQAKVEQETANLVAQAENIPKEGLVLDAQKCKLDAEFDLLSEQKLKAIAETAVLNQKKITEQAQTSGTGVDDNSVIGKQKGLYTAQTDGFKRDAEQKAAKTMIDTWSVRRTTDEGTVADGTNKLDDANIGRAVEALLNGVNA